MATRHSSTNDSNKGSTSNIVALTQEVIDVALDTITDGWEPRFRRALNERAIAVFVEHIKAGKHLPPIGVISAPEGYWLGYGAHRLEAYRRAKCTDTVPAVLLTGPDHDLGIACLMENASRVEVVGPERDQAMAYAYQCLEEKLGKSHPGRPKIGEPRRDLMGRVAKLFLCKPTSVQRALKRHDDLIPEARVAWSEEQIGQDSAYELTKLSPEKQRAILPSILEKGRDEVRRLVGAALRSSAADSGSELTEEAPAPSEHDKRKHTPGPATNEPVQLAVAIQSTKDSLERFKAECSEGECLDVGVDRATLEAVQEMISWLLERLPRPASADDQVSP